MAVVKINKLSVQEGMGEELERRFKNNNEKLNEVPGFLSFELLRTTCRFAIQLRNDSSSCQ